MPAVPAPPTLVTLDDIRAAASRIQPYVRRTPMLEVGEADHTGSPVFLKCENLQPAGAFKIRGASNMLAQLPRGALAGGVVTYSSGNHGQAVALAARRFGTRSTIVMPETAPRVKVDGCLRFG